MLSWRKFGCIGYGNSSSSAFILSKVLSKKQQAHDVAGKEPATIKALTCVGGMRKKRVS